MEQLKEAKLFLLLIKLEMKTVLFYIACLIILITTLTSGCKESYEPAVIKANKNFLVVDGVINTDPNSVTLIRLSRTRNVTDSVLTSPELHAQVNIIGKSGSLYSLHEQGKGVYTSDAIVLNNGDEYALQIITTDNNQYQSDYLTPKLTPAIDSIHYTYAGNGITLFANTHDPQNNTRYYRWDYVETWEYHAFYNAELSVDTGLIFYDVPYNRNFICYQSDTSTNILLGTSVNLAQDVISEDSLTNIPQNDIKVGVRYSILLKQYALSVEAYAYWQLLQKNTQQLGSLFDAQPTQLTGNVHSLINPSEPVLGYVSATAVAEKRLFIDVRDLPGWQRVFPGTDCYIKTIDTHADNFLRYDYDDTSYAPYYYSGMCCLVIAKKYCLDCTLAGGTNTKPPYW